MKEYLLHDLKQIQRGAIASGVGLLAYLAASAMELQTVAGIIAVIFAVLAVDVLVSVLELPKEEGWTYSLTWGQTSLAILLCACAAVQIKRWLGL